MVKEEGLKEPLGQYLYARFQDTEGHKFLCHEEPKCRKDWKPDIVFVHAPADVSELKSTIEVVEIENTLKHSIQDRRHGLNQLKKYPGHLKYLAIPHTIYRRKPQAIRQKCIDRRIGLLVVGKDSVVEQIVEPFYDKNSKSIRAYRSVRKRWTMLRKSGDRFRWIRHGKIYVRE